MTARIYQKAKSAMQSGEAGDTAAETWLLEYPRGTRAAPNAMMGWASSHETMHTIRIAFPDAEAAAAYAEANGIKYTLHRRPGPRKAKRRRAYADNFATGRREAWTH